MLPVPFVLRRLCALACLLGLACSTAPKAPVAGTGSIWGQLTLVPRAGVPHRSADDRYEDWRLRRAKLVDYSRVGFAVVFLDSGPAPTTMARLAIRKTRTGVRLEPSYAALGAGQRLEIRNVTALPHTISCPRLELLMQVMPGEVAEAKLDTADSDTCFLLDGDHGEATLFVSPGPFAVVSKGGRFELPDLTPGTKLLRVWHPRFPPLARTVQLGAEETLRIDLEMGVGQTGVEK